MKLINKDTDYAVKALIHSARNGGRRMSVADLAGALDIPYPFLRRIFQVLSAGGILKSSKGKGGGFELARPPEEIHLVDLIRILQGPFKLAECVFKDMICPDIKTCPLRKRMLKLQKSVVSELRSITIASLLEEAGNRPSGRREFVWKARAAQSASRTKPTLSKYSTRRGIS